ncbi:MATE family efflux transporter [Streptomonospora litoralis]|uniref:Probable multidrug resistance protein NorM n=1 Tax=Streptomonospora litoralis TaxID=2498135 RepID=A0A4P6Q1Z8_9ACTN|nr:MATE family efflux transporter [Streptomonospora litoralis]QBI52627.1 multidrug efflux protein [Streptomonospora litoralis]
MTASDSDSDAGAPARPSTRRAVLRLGAPIIVANLVNVFLPFVVLALMGRMSDEAVYLRSLFLPMSQLFVAFVVAVDMSNQVAVAVAHGAKRRTDVVATTVNTARIAFGGGIVLVAALAAAAPLFADLLHVEEAARAEFLAFARWTSAALVLQFGPAVCASALRGIGRAQAAMAVVATLAVLETAGVVVVGLWAGMGPMSLPASIAVSSVCAAAVGLVLLRREGLGGAAWMLPLSAEPARWLLRVGVPVAGTHLLLTGFTTAQLSVIGPYGPEAVAGFAAANTFQGVLLQPAIALGTATAILLNQNVGAGRGARHGRTLRAGMEAAVVVYAAIALAVWSGADLIGAVASANPAMAAETARFFAIVGLTYVLMGSLLTLFTIMEQVGMGFSALTLNIAYFAALVVVGAHVSARMGDPDGLYWTLAVGNVIGPTCAVAVVPLVLRRLRERTAAAAAAAPAVGGDTAPAPMADARTESDQ